MDEGCLKILSAYYLINVYFNLPTMLFIFKLTDQDGVADDACACLAASAYLAATLILALARAMP